MKRDWDLIRELLLDIEANLDPLKGSYKPKIEGRSHMEIYGHLVLLEDGGFISGKNTVTQLHSEFMVKSITYNGFDFLDTVRDNSQWKKIKEFVKSKGAPLFLETIKITAAEFVKNLF
jgi:hypothetical protein